MDFNQLFDFLEELQHNNSKEWMDENRAAYENVRDQYIEWLDKMNKKLASLDPTYTDTPGKKAINRINNNLMFHPNKPIYKDHFGAGLDQEFKRQGDFYIHLGVNECFVAGGYYHPSSKLLKNIRQGIDFNGDALKEILNKPSFKKAFGALIEEENRLVNAPKGYSVNHPHIDLLRYKSFAVEHPLKREEVLNKDFEHQLIELYLEMVPFRRYLNQAAML